MAHPIAILLAMDIEAEGVVSRLHDANESRLGSFLVTSGTLAGAAVVVTTSGAGGGQAHAAALELIARQQPSWVISAGFAGGLVPEIRRGDIVMADSVANEQQNVLSIDLQLGESDTSAGLHVGRLVSVSDVVVRPDEKRGLGELHGALAVDLESYSVASVCAQEKVRFMAIRVVSDTVDEPLPEEIRKLLAQDTPAARWGAVAGSLMRRPSSLRDLWTLRENAVTGSERLGQFLESVAEQLAAA